MGAYRLYQKHAEKKSEKLEKDPSRGPLSNKKEEKDALIAGAVGLAIEGVKTGVKAFKGHREKRKMEKEQERELLRAETGNPEAGTEELAEGELGSGRTSSRPEELPRDRVCRCCGRNSGGEQVGQGTAGGDLPPAYEQVAK